jgi:hypothetical protein
MKEMPQEVVKAIDRLKHDPDFVEIREWIVESRQEQLDLACNELKPLLAYRHLAAANELRAIIRAFEDPHATPFVPRTAETPTSTRGGFGA